ncbi:hypothetical protein FPV67DRAFT_1483469 [Lyophyllum atratum]|nr:hypothetical protein FPV67DRAFT_1483469 [Lyophyllum atratum]
MAFSSTLPIQHAYLSKFLFIPMYYASQALPVLRCLEDLLSSNSEGAFTITSVIGQAATAASHPPVEFTDITRPVPAHLDRNTTTCLPLEGVSTNTAVFFDEPTEGLRMAWSSYIDSRYREWAAVATSACTFAAASPAVLQLPSMNGNPITCSLVFLAILRAMAAIIYASMFLLYFRQPPTKSAYFAMGWFKIQKNSHSSQCTPWMMLALPAVSLCWGVILMMLALFFSLWSDGFAASPPTQTNIGEPQSSTEMILRILITTMSLVDLWAILWTLKTLQKFKDEALGF